LGRIRVRRRHLTQSFAVHANLEHLVSIVFAGHGEEHPVGIPMQVDVANEAVVFRSVNCREFAVGPNR
jgi:hypothetical protein